MGYRYRYYCYPRRSWSGRTSSLSRYRRAYGVHRRPSTYYWFRKGYGVRRHRNYYGRRYRYYGRYRYGW